MKIFMAMLAYFHPGHILDPPEKGMYEYGWTLLMFSSRNLSGLNCDTSSPHSDFFACRTIGSKTKAVPLGTVHEAEIGRKLKM